MNIPVSHYNNAVDALILAHEANEALDLYWKTHDKRYLYMHTDKKWQFNKLFRQFTSENKQLVQPVNNKKAA